jgi:uncharacterized protein
MQTVSLPPATTQTTSWIKRLALPLYFVLAFGLTWLFWFPGAWGTEEGVSLPLPPFALMVLGGLGPMLAAILVTVLESGWTGVRSLFGQLTRFRVNLRWYLVVFLLIPLLRLAPALLHLAQGGILPTEELLQQVIVLPLFFLFVALVGGGLDEEMGWRGYALPRLQSIFSPLWANLLLGVIWSCWHIPLWFGSVTEHGSLSFPIYLVSTTALSFVLAWVYNGTGNSLLLAVLAHTASNVSDNLRSTILRTNTNPELDLLLQAILASVMVVAALVIVVRTGGTLGHTQRNLP